jgi:putative heme-binding domain-containing protein
LPLNERRWNARDLSKDPVGAQMLLGSMDKLDLPNEVLEEIKKNLPLNADVGVRTRAAQRFAVSEKTSTYGLSEVMAIVGDAESGRMVFEKYCATCHRVSGKGSHVAPDLTNVSGKFDKEALGDAIINPSAGIVFGYEAWTVRTHDGMSYYGFVVGQTEESTNLKDLAGENHTIKTDDILSKERHQSSAMPDPSLLGLTAGQLADVIQYLQEIR